MSQDQRSKRKHKNGWQVDVSPNESKLYLRARLEMFCSFPEVFWSVYASDFDIK